MRSSTTVVRPFSARTFAASPFANAGLRSHSKSYFAISIFLTNRCTDSVSLVARQAWKLYAKICNQLTLRYQSWLTGTIQTPRR